MVVWFAKHFSHGCFGSRSGFLIAHQFVPPVLSFFCFGKCAAHAGRGTALPPWWFAIEPETAEVSPEIDLSSWSSRIVKSPKKLKN